MERKPSYGELIRAGASPEEARRALAELEANPEQWKPTPAQQEKELTTLGFSTDRARELVAKYSKILDMRGVALWSDADGRLRKTSVQVYEILKREGKRPGPAILRRATIEESERGVS